MTSPGTVKAAEEDSIVDEAPSVNSDSDSETVEWEVIEKGTERGKPKLVNRTGYSYTISRARKGTRYWKCSVQNKSNRCPAAVSEKAGVFTTSQLTHTHPPVAGARAVTRLKAASVSDFVQGNSGCQQAGEVSI